MQEQEDYYPLSLTTQEFAPFSIDVVGWGGGGGGGHPPGSGHADW